MSADERIMKLEERNRELQAELEKYRRLGVDPDTVKVVEVECSYNCCFERCIPDSDGCELEGNPYLFKLKAGA